MKMFKVLCTCILLCLITESLCMPRAQGFLDIHCDTPITCPKEDNPICCTDGNTYPNPCELDLENQRRICREGKFNPIAKVHDGPCVTTVTPGH